LEESKAGNDEQTPALPPGVMHTGDAASRVSTNNLFAGRRNAMPGKAFEVMR
jgi:hypothetical protein